MWALILAGALAAGPEFELRAADGQSIGGTLVQLSAEQVVLETADGKRSWTTDQVLSITPTGGAAGGQKAPSVWVELIDGSVLAAEAYLVDKSQASVTLIGGTPLSVPTGSVATVRLREQAPPIAQQWADILKTKLSADLLVLRKGESLDYVEGVIGAVDAENVQFNLDGEMLPVKRTKVEGLLYYHASSRELPAAFTTVADRAGSRLQVDKATVAPDALQITSPAGVQFKLPLESIGAINFKTQYLSDLVAESIDWAPFFGPSAAESDALSAFYRPRFDRALEPGPLRLGGQSYAKGIALHSRSELVYRLPGKFSTFRAIAGIDDRVRPAGDVRLIIYGDGRVLLDKQITGSDDPLPLSVDISGVTRLKIVADFGGDLDVSDHLDLCEPRVFK